MKPDKPLPGSSKKAARGARVVGEVDPEHPMSVTVVLRPKAAFSLDRHVAAGAGPLSREEFAAQYGASAEDARAVEEYAASHHLSAAEINLPQRTVVLRGRTADMQAAFGTAMKLYATPDDRRFRGRVGDVYIPHELAGIVSAVLGLDDRPSARPHLRRPRAGGAKPKAAPRTAPRPFDAPEVGKLYGFPTQLDGSGQCIAIIELGGGYRMADMKAYFKGLGLPVPPIVSVGVGGASNSPGADADGEVVLDIQVAGAVAPKARIAVYFAHNTDAGFLNAIKAAVHDNVRKPSVVSISWGAPENAWTAAALAQFDNAFQEAAALGVTVLAASGDAGSADGVADGKPHADFPASSPHVLACGGTLLTASGPTTIKKEVVWNEGPDSAGGGGVSAVFAKPAYQANAKVPTPPGGKAGRGVPDVAGNADPASGYNIVLDGSKAVVGGTSAVAPLYAGLTALINQALAAAGRPPVGLAQQNLYSVPNLCRDVRSGDNEPQAGGPYKAKRGWDASSGFGSAIGSKWLDAWLA
jgi:kumamolisin